MTARAAILLAAAGLALVACGKSAPDESNAMSLLPPCGASFFDELSGWTRYAAVDEGAGRVGLAYDNGGRIDAALPRAYYRLHDCRTGGAVGFDADGRAGIPTVEQFTTRARQDGLMSTPNQLVATALRAGFLPASDSRWGAEDMAEYATCACGQFYRGMGGSRGGLGQ